MDAHPRVAVLTAHIVVEPEGREDPICEDLRTSPLDRPADLPGTPLISFLAGASVVRRTAFLAAGGFEPRLFIGGEEELLASDLLRAGWGLVHVPEVAVHHQPSVARDPRLRRRQGIRNTLWFTWLRRPAPAAASRTVAVLRRLPRDTVSAAGLLDACRGIPWVIGARRAVPPEMERMYAAFDRVQFRSGGTQVRLLIRPDAAVNCPGAGRGPG